ncbi:MAG TPA: phosphoserine phosphatase SerB [Bacteriovoracaceae bacterium]|nr:phosphoserine phosphatase SerB [Bacteriovoracaceae bacterium]
MNQCILVTVSGPDHPGITSKLMKILVKNNTNLVDMGQAVTHGLLSLSFLLDMKNDEDSVLKDLLFESKQLGMDLDFQVLDGQRNLPPPKEKYILSCASLSPISAAFVGDVATLFSSYGINIQRIDNMSQNGLKSLDIAATSDKNLDLMKIKFELMNLSNVHKIDAAFMRDNVFRFNKRLIVFDMDSTLIQAEVIDEMAASFGIGDKVKEITERAMNGELNFDEALRERVALLKGMPKKNMEEIMNRLQLTPGAEKFIKTVRNLGFKTAIVSGGFKYFAENLRKRLDIDYAFANELEWDGDKLSGRVTGQIVNSQQKAFILELLAQQESIHLEQVVAVGDGANDLPMLAKAGLGIAFHAKEKVKREARHQMSHGPMTSILYFLGIPGNHLDETI